MAAALPAILGAWLLIRPATAAGLVWREVTPPPALTGHTLFYDEAGQRLLSLGGQLTYSNLASDFWSFEQGSGWKRVPGRTPQPIRGAALVLDTRRNRLVTFGTLGESLWGSRFEIATHALPSGTSWTTEPNSFGEFGGSLGVYDSTRDRIVTWRSNSDYAPRDAITREFRFGGTGWAIAPTSGEAPALFTSPGSAHLDRANERMIIVDHASGATWFLSLPAMQWTRAPDGMAALPAVLNGVGFEQAAQLLHAFDIDGRMYRRVLDPLGPWEHVATASGGPDLLWLRSSAWDATNHRFLVHGWTANAVWTLPVGGTWESLAPSRPTCPLALGNALCLDTRRKEAVLQTGFTTYMFVSYCYSVFYKREGGQNVASYALPIDQVSPDWTPVPVPGRRGYIGAPNSSVVYDAIRDRLLYFGGHHRQPGYCAHDFTAYYATSWSSGIAVDRTAPHAEVAFDVSTAPPPPARGYHGAVWDARRDRMLIVAGLTEEPGERSSSPAWVPFSDLWQLDGATLRWTQLATTGIAPSGRVKVLLDENRDRLLAIPSDSPWIHLLDLQTLAWTRVQPTGNLFGAQAVFALDPVRDRLLVFGGSPSSHEIHRFWSIQLDDLATTAILDYPGMPPFLSGQVGLFDPSTGSFVLHGGISTEFWETLIGGETRSTWMIQLETPTSADVDLASVVPLRDRIRLTMRTPRAGQELDVERRTGQEGWVLRTRVHSDGEGAAMWEDLEVVPGERYAYRAAWWDSGVRRMTAEHEVQMPVAHPNLRLASLHPNPVRDAMTLAISLPRPGPVELTVRDLQGRTVHHERLPHQEAGVSNFDLNPASKLAPGLYLVTVATSNESSSRRFVVVR